MSRLLIHVEGQTEEEFVNSVLASHLYARGFRTVSARLLGNARQRDRRGGIVGWDSASKDITKHLKEDGGCLATTMVDYYALPASGPGAWPGRDEAGRLPFARKATAVQDALSADISARMGGGFNTRRFIPYVMMHEFEGLLFSDCACFASGIALPGLAPAFQAIRDRFGSPEEINDSPTTAPSKRVEALVPGYTKPIMGTLAVLEIGLDAIRSQCPHFRRWIEAIESWIAPA